MVSVLVLFVSSAGMVACAMFLAFVLAFGPYWNVFVGACWLILAAAVYVLEVRSFALPGRSRSPALYRTRVVSLWRAPLPPVVCGLVVVVVYWILPFGILLFPVVLLCFVKWAHSARRRIADDVCALRGWWNVRRVREVVLLLEVLLIVATVPLFVLTIGYLLSLGYPVFSWL